MRYTRGTTKSHFLYRYNTHNTGNYYAPRLLKRHHVCTAYGLFSPTSDMNHLGGSQAHKQHSFENTHFHGYAFHAHLHESIGSSARTNHTRGSLKESHSCYMNGSTRYGFLSKLGTQSSRNDPSNYAKKEFRRSNQVHSRWRV